MWSYRLVAPYTFERRELPDISPESLAEGQVLLRFLAAGVCGSDLPGFRGTQGKLAGDTGASAEMDGFLIHDAGGSRAATPSISAATGSSGGVRLRR
jgi:threonine dehydrogenase-like Zn-dependent dehydrogenase